MELKDAIQNRASVRKFTEEGVIIDDLKEMVRRAGLAPSENNHQPWRFIAITNKAILEKLANTVSQKISSIPSLESKRAYLVKSQMEMSATFFKRAPSVIAMVMTHSETIWEKGINIPQEELKKMHNYPDLQSAGAAIQNILLSAVEFNYGACWMSSPLTAKEELEEIKTTISNECKIYIEQLSNISERNFELVDYIDPLKICADLMSSEFFFASQELINKILKIYETNLIFQSRKLSEIISFFEKEKISYIWINQYMRNGQVWSNSEQGILLVLRTSNYFSKVYDHENVQIWAYENPNIYE